MHGGKQVVEECFSRVDGTNERDGVMIVTIQLVIQLCLRKER
jgi:hypothetical protein